MNKITLILALFASSFLTSVASAQDVPADIRAKIEKTAKANTKIPEHKREAWVERQVEAWQSINAMSFPLPKTDVEQIKNEAQKQFPYHYSKQEAFIADQTEALVEIFELKTNFGKEEFEKLFSELKASKKGDYRAIVTAVNSMLEVKNELDQFAIEGMDATMFAIIKKGVAAQYPTDYKAQLNALKQQANLMALANEAKEAQAEKEKVPAEVKMSKTEQIKKAEDIFKKSTLILNSNGKTATGIVVKVQNITALMFPADLYSFGGLTATNTSGEEATISLEKAYAAKNAPLMLVPLPEIPIEVSPIEFASNDDIKTSLGQNAILIGNYNEMIRPIMIKITKVVKDRLLTITPISVMYYEGSLMLHPTSYKILGVCVKQPKELPPFDFTSNRLKLDFERAVEKKSRYLNVRRGDAPIKWEPINIEKMKQQMASINDIKELNTTLSTIISGKFSEAKDQKLVAGLIEKYTKVLNTRMDISKIKIEYRSYLNSLNVLIRQRANKLNVNDVYTNLKDDLGFQLAFTKEAQNQIISEMKSGSHSLAPDEFKDAYSKEGY